MQVSVSEIINLDDQIAFDTQTHAFFFCISLLANIQHEQLSVGEVSVVLTANHKFQDRALSKVKLCATLFGHILCGQGRLTVGLVC